jgi:hypothetical protein
MAAHRSWSASAGMTICALTLSANATKFFKEKVLGTDNSGCCFWWGRKPSLGEVKES